MRNNVATIRSNGGFHIAYALMGTYEHLWGICDLQDYNFDSRNTKYSFRPRHMYGTKLLQAETWLTFCVSTFDYYMSLKYLQTISDSSMRKYIY